MNPNPKTSVDAAPGSPAAERVERMEFMYPFATKSVERAAEAQKRTLDLAAEQYKDFIENTKKLSKMFPVPSNLFALDLAARSFQKFVETQKSMLDIMVEHTHRTVTLSKENQGSYNKMASGISGAIQKTVEQTAEVHKDVLGFAAEQGKDIVENTKEKYELDRTSSAALDNVQKGVEAVLQSQKDLVDAASRPAKSAAKA